MIETESLADTKSWAAKGTSYLDRNLAFINFCYFLKIYDSDIIIEIYNANGFLNALQCQCTASYRITLIMLKECYASTMLSLLSLRTIQQVNKSLYQYARNLQVYDTS